MIIGIDARMPRKNKTGVAYVMQNLVDSMLEVEATNTFKLLGVGYETSSARVSTFPLNRFLIKGLIVLWRNIFWPSASLFMGKTDAFFFTNFVDFPVMAHKKVLLIHDVSYIVHPEFAEKKNQKFLMRNVGKAVKRVDKIVTITENIKKEIVAYYKVPAEKVEVAYLGCKKNVRRMEDLDSIENVKEKYGISGAYILFVGTLEPRKNISGLIRAYSMLDREIQDRYKLVVSGGKGWHYDEIFSLAKECGVEERVVFTGYTDDPDQPYIYSGASVYVQPSFYEGFGLPLLEAMTCGVPVVSSSAASLVEVAGDAAIYADPKNPKDLSDKISLVISDDALRNDLVKKGLERSKFFSWEKTAKKVLEVLSC